MNGTRNCRSATTFEGKRRGTATVSCKIASLARKGNLMSIERRLRLFLFLPLLCAAGVFAQEQSTPSEPRGSSIMLDVVVAPKYGKPVSGLQQQEFTLLAT